MDSLVDMRRVLSSQFNKRNCGFAGRVNNNNSVSSLANLTRGTVDLQVELTTTVCPL